MARKGPADLRLEVFSDLFTPFEEYDRYSGIGASEVASIMGCGCGSPLTLARTKRAGHRRISIQEQLSVSTGDTERSASPLTSIEMSVRVLLRGS